jgi:hypothetical protein
MRNRLSYCAIAALLVACGSSNAIVADADGGVPDGDVSVDGGTRDGGLRVDDGGLATDGEAGKGTPAPVGVPLVGGDDAHIATDGTVFMASWTVRSGVQVVRFKADGVFLDAGPVTVAGCRVSSNDVAFDGTNFVVACVGGTQAAATVLATRFGADGHVVDSTPRGFAIVDARGSEGPSVALASNGANTAVVWTDPFTSRVALTRLGKDGVVGAVTQVGTLRDLPMPTHVSVGTDGTDYLVAFSDNTELLAQAVSGATPSLLGGRVVIEKRVAPAKPADVWTFTAGNPSVAWSGTEWAVAADRFATDGTNSSVLYRVSRNGVVTPPVPVWNSAPDTNGAFPRAVWSSPDWLLAYQTGAATLGVARVTTDGAVVRTGDASRGVGAACANGSAGIVCVWAGAK